MLGNPFGVVPMALCYLYSYLFDKVCVLEMGSHHVKLLQFRML